MGKPAPREVMERMIAAFATGLTGDCDQYISAAYVDHQGRGGHPLRGRGGFRDVVLAANRSTTPEISIEDCVVDSTRAVARLRWLFRDTDADTIVERETIEIIRVEGGRAVEHWGAESWSRTTTGDVEGHRNVG